MPRAKPPIGITARWDDLLADTARFAQLRSKFFPTAKEFSKARISGDDDAQFRAAAFVQFSHQSLTQVFELGREYLKLRSGADGDYEQIDGLDDRTVLDALEKHRVISAQARKDLGDDAGQRWRLRVNFSVRTHTEVYSAASQIHDTMKTVIPELREAFRSLGVELP